MEISKDYSHHSYKMKYVVGMEMVISYLDFKSSVEEYNKWICIHKQYVRERIINILAPDWLDKK